MASLEELTKLVTEFRDRRDWKKFHTPENLAKSITVEAAELLEHFQWGDDFSREEAGDELADVLIYALLMAEALGLDAAELVRRKVARNEARFPVDRVKGTSGRRTRVEGE